MQKAIVGVLVTLWAAQIAYAQGDLSNLKLVGDDLPWLAGEQSHQFTLRVTSTTSDPIVLAAWQLRCKIIPDSTASGGVFFSDSFSTSALFDISYSFNNDLDPPASPDISRLIVGYASDVVAVSNTGMDLLQIGLTATVGATGRFNIVFLPSSNAADPYNSMWYSDDGIPREFEGAGTSFEGSAVNAGCVLIVPEPAGVLLLSSGVISLWIGQRFKYRKTKATKGSLCV